MAEFMVHIGSARCTRHSHAAEQPNATSRSNMQQRSQPFAHGKTQHPSAGVRPQVSAVVPLPLNDMQQDSVQDLMSVMADAEGLVDARAQTDASVEASGNLVDDADTEALASGALFVCRKIQLPQSQSIRVVHAERTGRVERNQSQKICVTVPEVHRAEQTREDVTAPQLRGSPEHDVASPNSSNLHDSDRLQHAAIEACTEPGEQPMPVVQSHSHKLRSSHRSIDSIDEAASALRSSKSRPRGIKASKLRKISGRKSWADNDGRKSSTALGIADLATNSDEQHPTERHALTAITADERTDGDAQSQPRNRSAANQPIDMFQIELDNAFSSDIEVKLSHTSVDGASMSKRYSDSNNGDPADEHSNRNPKPNNLVPNRIADIVRRATQSNFKSTRILDQNQRLHEMNFATMHDLLFKHRKLHDPSLRQRNTVHHIPAPDDQVHAAATDSGQGEKDSAAPHVLPKKQHGRQAYKSHRSKLNCEQRLLAALNRAAALSSNQLEADKKRWQHKRLKDLDFNLLVRDCIVKALVSSGSIRDKNDAKVEGLNAQGVAKLVGVLDLRSRQVQVISGHSGSSATGCTRGRGR